MKKEEKKKNFGRAFCMVAIYIIIITVLCVAFQHYLYSPMRVIGDSMNPALSSGDILLVSESAYKEAEPGRFDLIVFKYKYDIHTRYIKRVIGLPGETVEIKDNTIYINGEELKEYYGYYGRGVVLTSEEAIHENQDTFTHWPAGCMGWSCCWGLRLIFWMVKETSIWTRII